MDSKQKLIATLHEEADEWLTERFGIDDTKMAKLIAEFTYENRQELAKDLANIRTNELDDFIVMRHMIHKVKDG